MNSLRRLSTFLLMATTVAGMVALTGCDLTNSTAGTGAVDVNFTDSNSGMTSALKTAASAPKSDEIAAAEVTITEVSVVPADETGEENSDGVQTLREDEFTIDLKELQDGVDETLDRAELPTGTTYAQLRLVTADEVQVMYTDDTKEAVSIASGQQTGLKLNFDPFTLETEDDRAEITVDFDVEETLTGSSEGEWVITPVVEATADIGPIDDDS